MESTSSNSNITKSPSNNGFFSTPKGIIGLVIAAIFLVIIILTGTVCLIKQNNNSNSMSYVNSSSSMNVLSSSENMTLSSSSSQNTFLSSSSSSSSSVSSGFNYTSWNKYTNSTYGLNMYYPASFKLNKDEVGLSTEGINTNPVAIFYKETPIQGGGGPAFTGVAVSYDSNLNNYSLSDYINNDISKWKTTCNQVNELTDQFNKGDPSQCKLLNVQLTQKSINGLNAYYTTGWRGIVERSPSINIFISYPNSKAILILSIDPDFDDANNLINSINLTNP